MKNRHRVRVGRDHKLFRHTAQKTKAVNIYAGKNMRGGIRL